MPDDTDHLRASNPAMDRLTVRFPAAMVQQIDHTVDTGEFPTRSEAIRAAVRHHTQTRTQAKECTKNRAANQ